MYTRLATLTVAGMMLAGPAFAATDSNRPTTTLQECTQLLEQTQQTVQEQDDVGEKAKSEIDALMVALQDQCNEQQFEDADQTAAYIRGLVATE